MGLLLPWLLIVAVLWVVIYLRLRRGRPADRTLAARQYATLHRIESRPVIIAIVVIGAFTSLVLSFAFDYRGVWKEVTSSGAVAILFLDFLILRPRRRRRFRERLVSEDYLICPDCLYSLGGLPDSGRCPECGAGFSHPDLVDEWNEILSLSRLGRRE